MEGQHPHAGFLLVHPDEAPGGNVDPNLGDWQTLTLAAGWDKVFGIGIRYRLIDNSKQLQVFGWAQTNDLLHPSEWKLLGTLPEGFRPQQLTYECCYGGGIVTPVLVICDVESSGRLTVTPNQDITGCHVHFNFIMPLD